MRIAFLLLFHLVSQALGEDGEQEKKGVEEEDIGVEEEDNRRNSVKQLHRRLFSNRRRSRFGVNLFRKEVEVPVMLMETTTEVVPVREEEEQREDATGNPVILSISRFSIFRTTTQKPKPKKVIKKSKIITTTTKKPKKKFSRKNLFPKLQLRSLKVENDKIDESSDISEEELTEQSAKVTKIKDQFGQQPDDLEKAATKEKKSILHALFCIRKQTARRHSLFKSRTKSKSKPLEEKKVDKSKEEFGDNRLSKALKKSLHRSRVRDHISKKLKLSQRQFHKFLTSALSTKEEDDLSTEEDSLSSNHLRRARSEEGGGTHRNQSDENDI